jgi:hypothetical protein
MKCQNSGLANVGRLKMVKEIFECGCEVIFNEDRSEGYCVKDCGKCHSEVDNE